MCQPSSTEEKILCGKNERYKTSFYSGEAQVMTKAFPGAYWISTCKQCKTSRYKCRSTTTNFNSSASLSNAMYRCKMRNVIATYCSYPFFWQILHSKGFFSNSYDLFAHLLGWGCPSSLNWKIWSNYFK